nr:lipid-binding SYLF domain-containing protein [uncultured Pseudodesulfovibrio sp.]
MDIHRFVWVLVLSLLVFAGCAGKTTRGTEADLTAANVLVDEAARALETTIENDKDGVLRTMIDKAKGVLIIPAAGEASLLISIGGGNAVLMASTDKGWTGPVFMTKGTVGYGFQAGFSKQSGVVLFMHEDDVRYMLQTGAIVQAHARLVVLNVDFEIHETDEFYESGDVYFVGGQSGLYAGLAVNSGGFTDRTVLNEAYTGVKGGGPRAVLLEQKIQPEAAMRLREMLSRTGAGAEAQNGDSLTPTKEKDGTDVPSN